MYQKSYSKEKSLRVKIAENKAVIYHACFGGCFGSGILKKPDFGVGNEEYLNKCVIIE